MSKEKKKWLCIDIILLVLLILADQFTKHLAVLHLKDQDSIRLIPNVLELQYLENRGAALVCCRIRRCFLSLLHF